MEEKEILKNKILLIEDEVDIVQVYSEVLTEAGYVVDPAVDGDSGMKKIKEGNWNLLLLDIMLPGKDGLRIIQEIKDNPSLKRGPIIALTNLNSENIIQVAFTLGVDGYLIKSEIVPTKIVDEIEKAFGKEISE
jgi:DNA-binding response OmpR family regulator